MTVSSSTAPDQPQPRRSRTIARLAAVQALFQCEQSSETAQAVIEQFKRYRRVSSEASFEDGYVPAADLRLFEKIVLATAARRDEIDATLSDVLPQTWPLMRLDPVLRALLRAAVCEMEDDLPARIVINEYLDVAHGFFSGDEPKMVNGILDTLARRQEVQPPA